MKIMNLLAMLLLNFMVVVVALTVVTEMVSATTVTEQQIHKHPLHRTITVANNADTTVDISWINPQTGSSVTIATSMNQGDTVVLDTYINHTLVVQPTAAQSSDDTSPAKSSVTQRVPTHNLLDEADESSSEHMVSYLTVSSEEPEQMIVIQKGLHLERAPMETDSGKENFDKSSVTSTAGNKKNPAVESMIESCRQRHSNNVTDLIQCVEAKTAATLIELNEELAYQRDLRRTIASMNENYTCTDITRNTTKPKRTTTWSYNEGSNDTEPIIRNVGILHEHRASQIHVIENFISAEECQAIQTMAEPLLHRGTVADGKGGSTMSPNRKAWQAGIAVDDYTNRNDPIANVKRRLFAYTNHAVPYNLTLDGQEELMSIQYFGIHSTAPRAEQHSDAATHAILSTPDRYTPHCDGDCNDMVHKTGSRIATMVMYCTIPEETNGVAGGGGTNFQQANVYVQPKVGSSVFFSYMDPITLIHDEGYTTHSGCPVTYGTKRIVVQWMRYGVDGENPWDSFDTNNIKLAERVES